MYSKQRDNMVVELNITEDTMGFVFENIISQAGVDEMKSRIASKLKGHKIINLYIEEDQVNEIKLGAFFDQVFFDISYQDRIKKLAVVSDRRWVRGISKLKDLLINTEVRAFELTERVEAICWVMKC